MRAHSSAAGAPKKTQDRFAVKHWDVATGLYDETPCCSEWDVLPLRFILTAGACHEVREAPALIAGYACEYVIADTAYDSDALRTQAIILGINGFSL